MMKILKTDRRTSMLTSTFSDLLKIQVEGPPLASFPLTELSNCGGRAAKQQGVSIKLLE